MAQGNLAALPTETVYGLGGLATLPAAISRIYRVKGRPLDHPVIVHIAGSSAIDHWAVDVPDSARALAEEFWPGPLTLVLPRASGVSDSVTGGQSTVALRAPAHPAFQQVLTILSRGLGLGDRVGIAAPSANRFGRVSPTTAQAVAAEISDRLTGDDVILDGGPCDIGVESTIVVCAPDRLWIAREGGITAEQLATVTTLASSPAQAPRVPGALASHYAPRARVVLASTPSQVPIGGGPTGLIALAPVATPAGWTRLAAPEDNEQYAHQLYAALRQADKLELATVVAVPPAPTGLGTAILDRLTRAATPT